VKIGDSLASWVSVDDDPPVCISDLQHAIKLLRSTKFPATEVDDTISTRVTERIDPIRLSINRLVSLGAANKVEIAAADNYLSLRDH
jgi:hypothetical protein